MCICSLVLLLNYVPELFLINIVLTLARSHKTFRNKCLVLSSLSLPSENSETTSTKTKGTTTGGGRWRGCRNQKNCFRLMHLMFMLMLVWTYRSKHSFLFFRCLLLPLFSYANPVSTASKPRLTAWLPDCLTTYILFPHANSFKLCIRFVLSPSEW